MYSYLEYFYIANFERLCFSFIL